MPDADRSWSEIGAMLGDASDHTDGDPAQNGRIRTSPGPTDTLRVSSTPSPSGECGFRVLVGIGDDAGSTTCAHFAMRSGLVHHIEIWVPSLQRARRARLDPPLSDKHPHAGGPDHFASYLENSDGFEVELVADESLPA